MTHHGLRKAPFVPLVVILFTGCSRQDSHNVTVAATRTALDQARVAELEKKLTELEWQREALEQQYKQQVLARHPEWTPKKQEQQLAVLWLKWNGSNHDSEDETVRLMREFGSRAWYSELVDDDF